MSSIYTGHVSTLENPKEQEGSPHWLINKWLGQAAFTNAEGFFCLSALEERIEGEKQRFHHSFEFQHSPVSQAFSLSRSFYFWALTTAAKMGKEQAPWADHLLGWHSPPHELPWVLKACRPSGSFLRPQRFSHSLFAWNSDHLIFTTEHQWPHHRCEHDSQDIYPKHTEQGSSLI